MRDLYPSKRRFSQIELNKIMGEHERYLARRGGCRAVLRSADLSGLILANRDLSEADFSGAILFGANLYGTNLTLTSFYCADLRNCNLQNTHLERADLRGASFAGANLSFAVMNYADLRAATMIVMDDKIENKGNTDSVHTRGTVNFSNCSLRNASFGNAKLDNVNFSGALLQGALFRGARLRNACFRGAVLAGVNLDDLNVPADVLQDCLLPPSTNSVERARAVHAALKAHHAWAISGGKEGQTATIDGEDLRPLASDLTGLCLAGLSACNVVALSVNFSGCQLQAARFDGSDLRAAAFTNADMSGISLDRANLAHANFRDALIEDFVLRGGRTIAAHAVGAQSTPSQFANAKYVTPEFLASVQGKIADAIEATTAPTSL